MSKKVLKALAVGIGVAMLINEQDKRNQEEKIARLKEKIVNGYKESLDEYGEVTPKDLYEIAEELCLESIKTGTGTRALFDPVVSVLKETGTLSPSEANAFHTKVCLYAKQIRPSIEERIEKEAQEKAKARQELINKWKPRVNLAGKVAVGVLATAFVAGAAIKGGAFIVKKYRDTDIKSIFTENSCKGISDKSDMARCIFDEAKTITPRP